MIKLVEFKVHFSTLATSVAASRTPRQKPDEINRSPTFKLTEQAACRSDERKKPVPTKPLYIPIR